MRHLIENKKAYYFSLDALIAIILLLSVVLFMHPVYKNKAPEMKIQDDALKVLSTLSVGEYALSSSPGGKWINQLIQDGTIKNTNLSVLEQIGEFYAFGDDENKSMLANFTFSDLGYRGNISLTFDNSVVYNTSEFNPSSSNFVWASRELLTGIKNGSDSKGYSSRAVLDNVRDSKYFYFGGFVGQKNVSALIYYEGKINDSVIEGVFSNNFTIFLSNSAGTFNLGYYNASNSTMIPASYHLPISNFRSADNNTIKLVGNLSNENNTYIAGGYIKVSYDSNNSYSPLKKIYLPGIEGVVNLYDSFYVPGDLNSMEIYLHYKNNYSNFFKIGNITIFNDSSEIPKSVSLNNTYLSSKLNYASLSRKTIPIRYGPENATFVEASSGDADVVLVTDVSGSMEWCTDESETTFQDRVIWDDATQNYYCGTRRILTTPCSPQKINITKDAENTFVDYMLSRNGTRVGVVDYSTGYNVNKINLKPSAFYVGSDTGCYIPNWHEENFDDSSWSHYTPTLSSSSCTDCMLTFRNSFAVADASKIKYLLLKMASDDGALCFINGKEIYYDPSNHGAIYWNAQNIIPKGVLKNGTNIIACTVRNGGSAWGFDANLITDDGTSLISLSIPENSQPYIHDPSMVLHYHLDDPNTIIDSSGLGNTGANTGATFTSSGKFSGAYSFNGNSNNYINTPSVFGLTNTGITLESWVYVPSTSDKGAFIKIGDGNSGFGIGIGSVDFDTLGNNLIFLYERVNWKDTGKQIGTGWHHVALVIDSSGNPTAYLDGVSVGTFSIGSAINPVTNTRIGGYTASGNIKRYFKGTIDEVAIYNKSLTSLQIQQQYNKDLVSLFGWKQGPIKTNCGGTSILDPKYMMAAKGIPTNFTLVTTLFNNISAITQPFNVSFYKGSTANELGNVTINPMDLGSLDRAIFNWFGAITTDTVFITRVNNPNIKFSTGTNQESITVHPQDLGADLLPNDFSVTPNSVCGAQVVQINIKARAFNRATSTAGSIGTSFNISIYKNSVSPANLLNTTVINGLNNNSFSDYIYYSLTTTLSSSINIFAAVDYPPSPNGVINEVDETNNIQNLPVNLVQTNLYMDSSYWYVPNYIVLNQPICKKGINTANFSIRTYDNNCPTINSSDLSASWNSGDYSNWQQIPPVAANSYSLWKSFNFTKDFQGSSFTIYAAADKATNNVSESNENDNTNSRTFNIGPDLFDNNLGLTITPSTMVENNLTNYSFSIQVAATQCTPVGPFNVSFYKVSISPSNLIDTQAITIGVSGTYTVRTSWSAALSENTTIIASIDSNNSIDEYNEGNNIYSNSIIITPTPLSSPPGLSAYDSQNISGKIIYLSLFPLFNSPLKFSNPFLTVLGILPSCPSNSFSYNLFSPPEINIVRKLNLTNNQTTLNDFINKTETWYGTCTCCGINSARNILNNTSNSSHKVIVVMSDGEATDTCSEQGTGNPKSDSIKAACTAANKTFGMHVYTIAFGSDADVLTMGKIAVCGNTSVCCTKENWANCTRILDPLNISHRNLDNIKDCYANISGDILNAAFKRQVVSSIPNWFHTVLYPDSYILLNYTYPNVTKGILVTAESPKLSNDSRFAALGNFSLPPKSQYLDANVISYSGDLWTDSLFFKNSTDANWSRIFRLADYGDDYVKLGDPYVLNIPQEFLSQGVNQVNISAATSEADMVNRTGSPYDKVIYTVAADLAYNSPIKASAKGCNWTIFFKGDATNTSGILIPPNYAGNSVCIYNTPDNKNINIANRVVNQNDAVAISTYYLLQKLDFDSDGYVDVKFNVPDLNLSTNNIYGIPFTWATDVQIKVWR